MRDDRLTNGSRLSEFILKTERVLLILNSKFQLSELHEREGVQRTKLVSYFVINS